ncbi:toll/interleukin-1 receptor domain-containing protein [Trichloromonas sp.]|uniref:toll/interleukin-1 receptor domain-containing protein n=1 Tax=Trichloromonas sp. TaxID=3069249 RepID=UPI002A4C9225|nr:toll/interleukin-1 receptor domain-containing protein [Trichloromonas sp.]
MAQIQVLWLSAGEQSAAEKILRRLRQRLGEDQVGVGTGPPPGAEGWLLLVIGPEGARSLREPMTKEVQQLAEALHRGIRVLPLLVAGAVLPVAGQLPEELLELTRHGALELNAEHWEADLERLFARLLGPVAGGGPPPPKTRSKFLARLRAPARPLSRDRPKMSGDYKKAMPPRHSADEPASAPPSGEEEGQERWTESPPPATAAPEKSEPEEVRLGAAAPTAVRPGSEFTASFTAYVPEQEEEVRRLLAKSSPRSETHMGLASCRWLQGTKVMVRLRGRGLIIDPPEQKFVWRGGRNLIPFDVEVPKEALDETVVLKFDVLIEETVVARLRLDLEIGATPKAEMRRTPAVTPARTAFASYSSRDRSRVLDRVDALNRHAGLEFFLDCIDLHQGEEWKPALAEAIHQQELFMLFWSRHSAASPWVGWELETAKQAKARDFIQIQALQPDLPPPTGFEAIHGSSVYLWVREGNEAVRNRPPAS